MRVEPPSEGFSTHAYTQPDPLLARLRCPFYSHLIICQQGSCTIASGPEQRSMVLPNLWEGGGPRRTAVEGWVGGWVGGRLEVYTYCVVSSLAASSASGVRRQ